MFEEIYQFGILYNDSTEKKKKNQVTGYRVQHTSNKLFNMFKILQPKVGPPKAISLLFNYSILNCSELSYFPSSLIFQN